MSVKEAVLKATSLYYRSEGSDKVYNAWIEAVGTDQFLVNFSYGRRGSTLTLGTKTASPVSKEAADKVYSKLLQEKTSKGYSPGEEGTPYQGTDKAGEVSGLVPQLLNPIDMARVEELLKDDNWFAQEKMDGFHQMARVDEDCKVTISNRKGLIVPGSEKVVKALESLDIEPVTFDGETIGDYYWMFDLLEYGGKDMRNMKAYDRYSVLRYGAVVEWPKYLDVVRTADSTEEKRELFEDIKAERGEGIVFKRKDALYVPGRPNSAGNMLKFKFVASATCAVIGINGSKRSVQVGVGEGVLGPMVPVGNVTIPPNHPIPSVGDMVEVEYLYRHKGGSLFQPVYKGVRTDKTSADVLYSLKLKQSTSEEIADE